VRAPEVAAVVDIVSVAVLAVEPAMFTGLVDPKLRLGGYCAPAGLELMVGARETFPVKPPAGVTVIVEVFPVVAPGEIFTARSVIANVGLIAAILTKAVQWRVSQQCV